MRNKSSHILFAWMLSSWMLGILTGFFYGLYNDWGSLALNIHFMIFFIVGYFSYEIIKRSKE